MYLLTFTYIHIRVKLFFKEKTRDLGHIFLHHIEKHIFVLQDFIMRIIYRSTSTTIFFSPFCAFSVSRKIKMTVLYTTPTSFSQN